MSFTDDPARDYDDWCRTYYDDDRDAERDEWPEFGCACEDALVVDTTCAGCIAYLQEQHEESYWADQNVATVEDPASPYVPPPPPGGPGDAEIPF